MPETKCQGCPSYHHLGLRISMDADRDHPEEDWCDLGWNCTRYVEDEWDVED
jgi:hypothetical protein